MEIKAIYNQRDPRWANKIYSAKAPHTETIKSSGCGPTSAAMIISNLTDVIITPDIMANYSIANGYRLDGVGTAFGLFHAIAKKYNLKCVQTKDINQAFDCVKNGGMVVCSTNGGVTGLFLAFTENEEYSREVLYQRIKTEIAEFADAIDC